MIDLPFHIKRLRIVTLEQAALAMAGISGECCSFVTAITINYRGYEQALIFKEIICQAIKLKEVIPLRVYKYFDSTWDLPADALCLVENDEININTQIVDANFLAKDIWPWVENELSENTSFINYQPHETVSQQTLTISQASQEMSELKNKIAELEREIKDLKKSLPLHLGTFIGGMDKDPLYQAIRIRNSEWANYDPNDNDTRANQQAIITELKNSYGFVEFTAKAIEKIACPIDRNPSKVA
ncbi:hypothetical protein R0K81_001873 [Salmonella enterica]|nr:hypothetical protein [Salmonella enterica]